MGRKRIYEVVKHLPQKNSIRESEGSKKIRELKRLCIRYTEGITQRN